MDLFKGICLFLKIFVVTLLRITKKEGIVHHEPPVQFINLKSYDEDCLLRQCFTISTTTNKTVTQTQVKPFCLSKVDSFLSFMILTVFPHGYRKWFPCRLSPPYSLWLQFPSFYSC